MKNVVPDDDYILKRFLEFHSENPHVYELFEKFTKEVIRSGRSHYGAKAIMERIRWHLDVETSDAEGFKINNNYTSLYVRLLERRKPMFEGFFSKREVVNELPEWVQ